MAAYGSTNLTVETRSPPRDQQKRPSITTHSPGATTIVYDEEAAPPPSPTDQAEARVMRRSLEANVVLTVAKVAVAFQSGSLAVLASLIDSALDLISQIVLFAASARRKDRDVEYPAGRARLEPVGVVVCAMLMGVGSVYVIITSTEQLTDIVKGKNVHVALDRINGTNMVLAIVWKALLYALISKSHSALSSSNPGVAAVALDHFNDVLSNLVAVIAAVLAAWYGLDAADPAGAIAISLYIAYSWLETSIEQVQHLVGRTADPEFLEELREAASTYSRGCSATSCEPTLRAALPRGAGDGHGVFYASTRVARFGFGPPAKNRGLRRRGKVLRPRRLRLPGRRRARPGVVVSQSQCR